MLYNIYFLDDPAKASLRTVHRDEHMAYLEAQHHVIVLSGALLSDDGGTPGGSCMIVNVTSRAEADAFVRNEPYNKAGLFRSVRVSRMRRGHWNPEAAPKTPDGN